MSRRRGGRVWIANWRTYDAGPAEKTWLGLRNTLRRARNRSLCCGNHGEPGC